VLGCFEGGHYGGA
jgi:hypothetical protein